MNLKQLTESLQWYSDVTDEDAIIEYISKKCSHNIKSGRIMFRGQRGDQFMFYDTSKPGDRRSANSKNYYTLFMDNMPQWEHFPKRSKSLIGSSNVNGAYTGSRFAPYLVVPEDDCKMAACPYDDIWYTLRALGQDYISLNRLNGLLWYCAEKKGIYLNENPPWSELRDVLDSIEQPDVLAMWRNDHSDVAHFINELMQSKGLNTMLEVFEEILDPKRFTLIGTNDKPPSGIKEMWTSGRGVLIGGLEHLFQTNPKIAEFLVSQNADYQKFIGGN
jgi:hypothetical protein